MQNNVTTDASKILAMFNEFSSKERKQSLRNALRKAALILRKKTVENLKNEVKDVNSKNGWNGKSLQSGVRIVINKKNNTEAKVHILGDFRLKFFELGTKIRYAIKRKGKQLSKQANRGQIVASHFFVSAKKQSEQQVFDTIEKVLSDSIIKINNKHK